MWRLDDHGQWEYCGGLEDWAGAAHCAGHCRHFRLDDESEWVADHLTSCYNCRYRRWTAQSFICLAASPPPGAA